MFRWGRAQGQEQPAYQAGKAEVAPYLQAVARRPLYRCPFAATKRCMIASGAPRLLREPPKGFRFGLTQAANIGGSAANGLNATRPTETALRSVV